MKAVAISALSLWTLLCTGLAAAQGTSGAASSMVIPVAAKTGSFETEVFVRSAASAPLEVDVLYFEANGLPSPGPVACTFVTLPVGATVRFGLGTQCPSLASGSHFGMLVLRDRAPQKVGPFYAYSRVQHVTTNQGFSIEGFPEETFSGAESFVIGLKRTAAPTPPTQAQPGAQTNCFVGSLGEAVNYSIEIRTADNVKVGNTIAGSLGPYQLVRYLDIFAAAGIPPGDLSNMVAVFNDTDPDPADPALVGLCTLQENFAFGADFRVAKSIDGANLTKRKVRCRGTTTNNASCATLTDPATLAIPNAVTKQRFSMFVNHPDYLRCDIVGPGAANLEIRLLGPTPAGQAVGAVVAGGNDVSDFYHATGARDAAVASIDGTGFQTFWNLEVSPRESSPPAFPAVYGLRCLSGSGLHLASNPVNVADDF